MSCKCEPDCNQIYALCVFCISFYDLHFYLENYLKDAFKTFMNERQFKDHIKGNMLAEWASVLSESGGQELFGRLQQPGDTIVSLVAFLLS